MGKKHEKSTLEDKVIVSEKPRSQENIRFDEIVGELEELLVSLEFEALEKNFFSKHCMVFTEGDDDALECFEVFKAHVSYITSLARLPTCGKEHLRFR